VLLIVAGLISMPITTRLLSKEEYKLLSLAFATVAILAIAGTLGFCEATVRLYGEHRAEGAGQLRDLCDTMLGGSLAASVLVAVAAFAVAQWIDAAGQSPYARCLRWGSVLVVIRVLSGVVNQIYRAQERAGAYAAIQVGAHYGTVAVALALLLLAERSAAVVIIATVMVETVVMAIALAALVARAVVSPPRPAAPVITAATAYGLPLALAAAVRLLLDYGDRFLIERFLGLGAVGSYSVPYDLAQRVADALIAPVALAVPPVLFRRWGDDGREATSQFASRIFTYAVAVMIPVAALYVVVNQDLIVLLASERYRDSAMLTPLLLPGVLAGSLNFIVIAGLTIEKNTSALALNVCGAGVLNLALNLLFIPWWHLSGAALATSLAYGALLMANYQRLRSVLALRLSSARAWPGCRR
jgi:O-antigen/teichoic acid export membrane protein